MSTDEKLIQSIGDYKYGFKDPEVHVFKSKKGLDEGIVRQISQMKEEPEWMLKFRLKALEHFKAAPEKFNLVITDMTMPRMTGDQFIAEMIRIKPHVKTIICTGYSEKVNETTIESIGASGYMMKPIGRETLAKTVRLVLDETII